MQAVAVHLPIRDARAQGLSLARASIPSTTTVLPNLRAFIANPGSVIEAFDEWPNLVKVHLFDITAPESAGLDVKPPFAILRSGKVKRFWLVYKGLGHNPI